jgi:hypothetical protein
MPRKVPTKQTTLSLLEWGPVLVGARLDVAAFSGDDLISGLTTPDSRYRPD